MDSAQSIVSRFRPTLIATVGDTALHPAIARTGVPVVAAPFGADRHLVATEPRSEPHQPLIVLRLSDHVPTPDEVAHIADRYAAVVRRAAGGAGSNEAPYWGSFFHLRTSSKLHLLVNEGVAVEVEARAALRSAAIGGVPICSPDAAAAVGLRNGVNCMTLDGLGDAIAVIDGLLADRPWVDELSAAALRHVIDQHLLDDRWRTLIADASPSSAPTPTSDAEPVLPVAADLMEALLELAELTPPEEVDAAGRAVDLRQGSIDSSGMGEAPPFVAEIDRDQARFHLSASGPSAGDVVEYRLPIHHGRRDPVRIEVVVRSPYERPQNAGRLRYAAIVDDRRLVSEDIALRSEANLVSFEFRPTKDVSVLRIMVEAMVDCEEWSFGRAGRLEVGPVRYWTGDYALTSTVTASSPEATIYS